MEPAADQEQGQEQEHDQITPARLTRLLASALPSLSHVEIADVSGGCGTSFTATLVSPVFAGKTTLARHRLVNAAVRGEVARIHAWSLRCFSCEEWEGRKKEEGEGKGEGKGE